MGYGIYYTLSLPTQLRFVIYHADFESEEQKKVVHGGESVGRNKLHAFRRKATVTAPWSTMLGVLTYYPPKWNTHSSGPLITDYIFNGL